MKLTFNPAILALLALMTLTRLYHFGSAWSLPDATLAVFFLAGWYVSNRVWLAGLLVAAGLLDYLAINQFNVSDWCLSPAYIFLIPTYSVMWLAGRYGAKVTMSGKRELAVFVGLAAVVATLAFIISNGSFYFFSGRYAELPAADYALAVATHFPAYLGTAMAYALAGLAVAKASGILGQISSQQKAV